MKPLNVRIKDFTTITASEYLLNHISFTEVEHTVDAIAADPEIERLLDLGLNTSCLRLTHRPACSLCAIVG